MKTKKFTVLSSVTTKGDYTNTFMCFETLDDLLQYYRMLLMLGYTYDYKVCMFERKTLHTTCRVIPLVR